MVECIPTAGHELANLDHGSNQFKSQKVEISAENSSSGISLDEAQPPRSQLRTWVLARYRRISWFLYLRPAPSQSSGQARHVEVPEFKRFMS